MVAYRKLSDDELTHLLKDGDHTAFTEIYNRYWPMLFRHARKMLNNGDEAADIIQDVFTTLWNNAGSLNIHANLSGYLYASVRHKVFTLMTRSKLKESHLTSLKQFIDQGAHTTEEWIYEKQLAETIEAEVNLLPEKMRKIFQMSREEHLSYQQIAEKLEVTDHTVRKQISNALKVLKAKINTFLF